ncbi:GNAT family N-acetyltransferase [Thermoactinospora rubra]|uniref:GNAT family N-acetyltransferase n=1 Tax=Thermoactinospora rubra TaxID=1088767 RepID=UPI000A11ADA3|nr:GNAT family N-acetyltransferase [Thermoactinospora rubra]
MTTTVRELRTVREFAEVHALFDAIWHPGPGSAPAPVELMVALAHAGGYVAGAYEGGELVGASVGFLAEGGALHSHITGVLRPGGGVGYAIKMHQRAWCLERGLTTVTWTFDPLVRRNAYFNIAKLGARPREYLEDFYGPMGDAVNAGDVSDRLLVAWRLAGEEPPPAGPTVLVPTPEDVEALRARDPAEARRWRLALRETLGGLMAEGGKVIGFTKEGQYVAIKG